MSKSYILILFLFVSLSSNAQAIFESVYSEKLGADREIKVMLPRGYSNEDDKRYPVIYVFDGDYLFEPVSGDVDYFSYWEDMPEAIVVGVKQAESRDEDCFYSEQNSMPVETGASFFEFVGFELVSYIDKTYKTEVFRVALAHGKTANFINYFLLKPQPLFNAYIVLSPDLAPNMDAYITESVQNMESKVFYYMATSTNDVKRLKEETTSFNTNLEGVDNKNFLYNFDTFDGPSHYSLPAHAIPKAIESIFLVFQPISKKEYKETILKLEGSPVEYLLEKYSTIEELFGIDKQILINDFKAIAAAIKKTEKFEYFEELGKIARKEYPDALLGHYYLARFYEESGEPKKAMKTYRSAYVLNEIGGLTKDMMLERADNIKADFGY
ncbi:MAG: esterase [Bacteroidetes bacterium MedPE-SWsnd-G2]|nr:MAG: esterase [Bacteroidetes bacterium MedPE-SWsnd-G2]